LPPLSPAPFPTRRSSDLYAGLAQVPGELIEAAEVDGARSWRIFFDITLPILKPILLILTSLSIIWDFGVFTQPYLLIGQSKITTDRKSTRLNSSHEWISY